MDLLIGVFKSIFNYQRSHTFSQRRHNKLSDPWCCSIASDKSYFTNAVITLQLEVFPYSYNVVANGARVSPQPCLLNSSYGLLKELLRLISNVLYYIYIQHVAEYSFSLVKIFKFFRKSFEPLSYINVRVFT